MKQNGWWLLFAVTSVLLLFFAFHALREPPASEGAQRIAAEDSPAQAEDSTINPFRAAYETPLGHLGAIREAQRIRQQEAARELQLRELQATRP
jgi:hypothetical protein